MNRENNTYRQGHKLTKAYFYIQRGLALVNEFKYLIIGIVGFYYMLKLDNFLWLIVIGMISLPILLILGWLAVHKMAKVLDWLGIEYATYWGRYSFTLLEKQIELLEKLNEKLNEQRTRDI